ncbi:MAG: 1-deoxy-D-xylulose-5-phosphate synthase [Chloroflexi bacterium]|nr:1-deoxy-D-xylulose-5-phosphate synthase [Chloroflexota bacterium]
MRGTFIRTLTELAERDSRILLLTGDLGYTVVEPFQERFPDRFFNVGVAEQNMVGMATGLAEAGYTPFVYSIATFASLRPYEFIRNGPVLQHLPVRVVGVGGGVEYGTAGPTHHALEDVGIMRLQPGMTVVAPADYQQCASALRATLDVRGPIYFRLGKDDRTTVPGLDGAFRLGHIQVVRQGHDLLLLSLGSVTAEVVAAAETLAARGVACTVAVVASVTPPPIGDLVELLGRFRTAVTVEAHYTVGGLGSLASEVVAEHGLGCRVVRRGVDGPPFAASGSERYLWDAYGLSCSALVEAARGALEGIVTEVPA